MRCVLAIIACCGLVACVADHEPGLAELDHAATTRTSLEANFDSLLRARGGACGLDRQRAREVCVITRTTTPPRSLQIGDPVPTPTSLQLCWAGAGCAPIPPAAGWGACQGLAMCIPLAAACPKNWDFSCAPVADPTPGDEIACACQPK